MAGIRVVSGTGPTARLVPTAFPLKPNAQATFRLTDKRVAGELVSSLSQTASDTAEHSPSSSTSLYRRSYPQAARPVRHSSAFVRWMGGYFFRLIVSTTVVFGRRKANVVGPHRNESESNSLRRRRTEPRNRDRRFCCRFSLPAAWIGPARRCPNPGYRRRNPPLIHFLPTLRPIASRPPACQWDSNDLPYTMCIVTWIQKPSRSRIHNLDIL